MICSLCGGYAIWISPTDTECQYCGYIDSHHTNKEVEDSTGPEEVDP